MSAIPDFRIVLFSINPTTNARTNLYTSGNYSALVATGTTPLFNSFPLPALNYINSKSGDRIMAEIQIFGTGTYNLIGQTLSSQLPSHPTYGLHGLARRGAALDFTVSNTGANGANNNSKSGVGDINITATVDGGATCVYVTAAVTAAAAGATWSANFDGQPMTQVASVQLGATNHYLRTYVYFMPEGAAVAGRSGNRTVNLHQNTAGFTWNASISAQTFIGPQSVGTPATWQSVGQTGIGVTYPSAATQGLMAVSFAGFNTFSGVTNWFNVAAGNVNAAGTFPMISGYANGQSVASLNYQTNMATNTNYAGVVVPLVCSPPAAVNSIAPLATPTTRPVAYSNLVPWIGLSGAAAPTSYSPVTRAITPGTTTINPTTLYPWANYFDVVGWGGGGGGANGTYSSGGLGAYSAGVGSYVTIPKAAAGGDWTLTVGAGGPSNSNGYPTTVVTPSGGTVLAVAGGVGNSGGWPSQGGAPGPAANTVSFNDANGVPQTYGGGAGGASAQANGSTPGGGGAGGNSLWIGTYIYGGWGGDGVVYIRAYQ